MTDEYKFEIKEDTFSVKVPILTDLEKQKIDNNLYDIVEEFTKALIRDKDMAIAQYIINIQNKKIEQFEENNNKALNYIYELKEQLTKELNYRSTAREAKIQLRIVDIILKIMKGEKNE